MRKTIIALILVLASASAMAQTIAYDEVNGKVRQTICSSVLITPQNSHEVITVALAGFESLGIKRYSLAASIHADHKFYLADNASIVITLGNGKTMALPGAKGGESILRSLDVNLEKASELTTRYNYYTISKKQIREIEKRGIASIAVELDSVVMCDSNMSSVAGQISRSYALLEQTLKGSKTK